MQWTHDLATTMSTWHWSLSLLLTILMTVVISRVIAWACDHFEPAAGHLGRNWPAGIRGATINAVGSSMPELWTTVGLLFFVGVGTTTGVALLGAGISVTAGSAVFNSVLIPAAVIFAVTAPFVLRILTFGLVSKMAKQADSFVIDKRSVARDLVFMLIAEVSLIYFLHNGVFQLWMCLSLLGLYAFYVLFMWQAVRSHEGEETEAEEGWTNKRALWTLCWTTLALVVACYCLGEIIVISAVALGIHPIISAVFFGAAASSVPDVILSVKDARAGNYEDAIANAVGSNTFDICVALAGPMAIYILMYGEIVLPDHAAVEILRIGLLLTTVLVVGLLLLTKQVRSWIAWVLMAAYLVWIFFVLDTEFGLLFFSGT